MNKLVLITCLFAVVGAASASPAVRESRHAVPIAMVNGMVLIDDDLIDNRNVMSDEVATPTILATRNTGSVVVPQIIPDQQTEQQRLTIGLNPYGGYYGGRPYGGYYGGRPWGPYGGRPWGPYGRPWGPYMPYRPWGPY